MRTCISAVLMLVCLFLLSCNQKNIKVNQIGKSTATSSEDWKVTTTDEVMTDSFYQSYVNANTQHFHIPAGRKKKLTTKGGVKIVVDPSKLETSAGKAVGGEIRVEVLELYKPVDFMKANAATVSNGKLLASGGSFRIEMYSGSECLKIRQGEALSMEFPRLMKQKMQIFYGERDEDKNMNWIPTSTYLNPVKDEISFSNGIENAWFQGSLDTSSGYLFPDMQAQLFFGNRFWTLKEYVDTMQARGVKIVLNRISFWPTNLPTNQVLDTNYLISHYGPRFQYTLTSAQRHDSLMQAFARRKVEDSIARIDRGSLVQRLGAYYEVTPVTQLGWINIDRFYKESSPCDQQFEFPIAVKDSRLHYFLLFKKINGMMNGVVSVNNNVASIGSLPKGLVVSLLGYAAKNGIIYKTEKTFEIGKYSLESLSFEPVSRDELQRTFGKNVSFSN